MVLAQSRHSSEEFMIYLSTPNLIPFLVQHVLPSRLRDTTEQGGIETAYKFLCLCPLK